MEKKFRSWPSCSKHLWLGGAKVSCIFCNRGVQLILAYSWARPAILVAGKGREVMFLFLLFLHFHSCSSFFPVPLFHLFCYLICLFSLSLGDDTKWPTRVDVSLNPNSVSQSIVSLTSSLRVISLTVLADSIYNILIFFAEKMWVAFALQKLLTFFQQKIAAYLRITGCKF